MQAPPRLALTLLAAAAIATGSAGQALADAPNINGQLHGKASATPQTPAYDAPRPAGGGDGRKIG